jgi:hypothetical protein
MRRGLQSAFLIGLSSASKRGILAERPLPRHFTSNDIIETTGYMTYADVLMIADL